MTAQHDHRVTRTGFARVAAAALGVLFLGLAAFAADRQPESCDLRWKWPVGKELVRRLVTVQDQEITGAGAGPMRQSVRQEQDMALRVLAARPGGGYELEMEILRVKLQASMGGATILSYDSEKESLAGAATNLLAQTMGKLVGLKLRFLTNAKGEVEEVKGGEAALKRIEGSAPAPVLQGLKKLFSKEGIQQMGLLPQHMPQREVKVGEKWPVTSEIELPSLGKVRTDLEYTLRGVERHKGRRCALLEYRGTISGTSSTDAAATAMKIDLKSGEIQGKSWFDLERGWMIESAAKQKMKIDAALMGRKLGMTIDQNITNTLISVQSLTPAKKRP
ncbi:MAG: hypothetical protein J7M29_09520 [Verrucomicrobia bacterium]|nr:hypothetical protein [Verrucomicrobiota bacterium]